MEVYCGLKSGAVLQRDGENVCQCYFSAHAEGTISSSLGHIEKCGEDSYVLSGIPVGGPYEIKVWDDASALLLTDIYVGDLWLLAGQSNMEGSGKWREAMQTYDASPKETVRAYYMNESWGAAKTQLHQLWESIYPFIHEPYRKTRKESPWGDEFPAVQNDGVGPGLFFALEMERLSGGVPQGVIPCAVGGSSLSDWNPDNADNLYTAAICRFRACGGHIRGIFWHQGESQAPFVIAAHYVDDMKKLVASFRKDCKNPRLPFVQVQINKYVSQNPDREIAWTFFREKQRTLSSHIENLATVWSVDAELDDSLHLASESQIEIGGRAAEAMSHLLGGEGFPSPDFDGFEIIPDDFVPHAVNIRIHFKNIVGGLTAKGVPSGLAVLEKEDGFPVPCIQRICLEGDSIRLKINFPEKNFEDLYIAYAHGNSFYCNITDGRGRSIPGFGPLKVADYLKKGE